MNNFTKRQDAGTGHGLETGTPNQYQIWDPVKSQARVVVVNETSTPICSVSVVHKYSDVYKNRHEWPAVLTGTRAESEMTVDYQTGAATTGRDWWIITWYSEDMKTLWYSDPNNFRGLLDKLESLAPDIVKEVAERIDALLAKKDQASEEEAMMVADLARFLARATTDHLFNSEATERFKQHILREEDADALTEIVINPDRTITFQSKSGNSNTVASHKALSAE